MQIPHRQIWNWKLRSSITFPPREIRWLIAHRAPRGRSAPSPDSFLQPFLKLKFHLPPPTLINMIFLYKTFPILYDVIDMMMSSLSLCTSICNAGWSWQIFFVRSRGEKGETFPPQFIKTKDFAGNACNLASSSVQRQRANYKKKEEAVDFGENVIMVAKTVN